MAVPSSGEITLQKIYNEVHASVQNYNSNKTGDNVSLNSLSTGGVNTINTANDSADRPDGSAPHSMSEFYAYDQSAVTSYTSHLAEDFTGDVSTYDDASRTTYSTTAWADSGTTPNMSDVNSVSVTTRPTWISRGTKDSGDEQAYWDNTGNSTSWHNSITTFDRQGTTDFDTGVLAYGECFNVQFRFYMATSGTKDFIVYLHSGDTSVPTSIGNAGNYVRWQFRDNSDGSYPRKISSMYKYGGTNYTSATSTSQFSTNTWYTMTCSIKNIGYMNTETKCFVSTTDGSVGTNYVTGTPNPNMTRFYGLTLLTVRAGNSSTKNYLDWVRCWMSSDYPS